MANNILKIPIIELCFACRYAAIGLLLIYVIFSFPLASALAGTTANTSVTVIDDAVSGGGTSVISDAPPIPPAQGFSISINNASEETDSRIVDLVLGGGPDTVRMAVSNFSDFRFASQETYQGTKKWTLTENEGIKTIYAKFYNQYGQSSAAVSDSITYAVQVVVPAPEEKVADANSDGAVNILDLNSLMINWGKREVNNTADFSGNGVVDIFDFNMLMINWTL